MALIDLTETNFDELTETSELMLLDFWAPWCGPCGAFAPLYAAVASRHPDVLFGRIDTEAEPNLAKQFEIFSIPTIIAAKNGTIFYARPGVLSEEKLERLIGELRNSES